MADETNFIALVRRFKFEVGPTFVLACDTVGLAWLQDRFCDPGEFDHADSFLIGDQTVIASDDKCRLTVVRDKHEPRGKIFGSDGTSYIWHITRAQAASAAAKLLSLLTFGGLGHQYLDIEGGRHRTVVVTKGEYTADVLRAMRDERGDLV
jgi:hypothetical protein